MKSGQLVTESSQDHGIIAEIIDVFTRACDPEIFCHIKYIENGRIKYTTLPEYRLKLINL